MDTLSQYEPTAEEMAEASYHFARMSYELQPFTVKCMICGCFATGSHQQLEKSGWMLNMKGEWCPEDKAGTSPPSEG